MRTSADAQELLNAARAADAREAALLAENQQLREALRKIAELDEHGVSFIARDALAAVVEE